MVLLIRSIANGSISILDFHMEVESFCVEFLWVFEVAEVRKECNREFDIFTYS